MKQKVGYFLMEIEFLGTGAGSPAKFRNVSSLALKLLDESNEIWLFDVGEGTQHQILNSTIRPRKVDRIFITHLHGDHLFGLPGFLSSRSFQGAEQMGPLNIYGPKGIKDYVMNSLHISQTKLTYKIIFNELSDEGLIFEDDCFKVYARFLDHRITCFGYRVVEKDRPGTLKVDKLIAEHVPSGPIYGQLKSGKTIKLPDGRILNGLDYIGKPKKGRIVAILGDTRQTDSIAKLAKDADVLVHESTFSKNEGRLAYNYYHSTNVQAAKIARDNNVKQLYLNHISARYVGQMVKDLQKDACKVFKNTRVVRDFDIYEVPQPNTKD